MYSPACPAAAGAHESTAGRPHPASLPPKLRTSPNELAPGKLLIATPSLRDPNFRQSVVLLLEYDAPGTLGLIVNRRSDVEVRSLLPEVEELAGRDDLVVYLGGPVKRNQIILLLRGKPLPETEPITGEVSASTSIDVLRAAARSDGPEFRAYAGSAGWAPGQLDAEVERGYWLIAPGDVSIVFATDPDTVWPELIRRHSGHWVRAALRAPARERASCGRTVVASFPRHRLTQAVHRPGDWHSSALGLR